MVYIDIKKQAIVSCTSHGFKNLEIKNDSSSIILEGTPFIIYFNKKNLIACTTISYDSVVYDYVLKLKPNITYTVTSRIGGDQGPNRISFKQMKQGKLLLL